jgi:tripartite-type tricarboxylate transporter receptor subunit TctC
MMQRRQILAGLAAIAASPALAQAQWSPDRPIRVIVPFAPGGSTDITARLVAEAISARLGQPVVIENRPGAAGNIGSEAVARAAPDGYTLVMATSSTHATNAALYRNMPFDAQRDFAPISQTTFIPNLLVVHPDVPARDFAGLVAEAKAKPGVLNFGNAGSGTSQHLSAALIAARTGIDVTHVSYRGGTPAVTDLMGGKIQAMAAPLVEVIAHVHARHCRDDCTAFRIATGCADHCGNPAWFRSGALEWLYGASKYASAHRQSHRRRNSHCDAHE